MTQTRKLFQLSSLALMAGLLAACQTTTVKLSPEQIKTYSLTAVDVHIDKKTRIKWPKYEKEKAALKSANQTPESVTDQGQATTSGETLAQAKAETPTKYLTPEEYDHQKLIAPVQAAYIEKFNEVMTGDKPIKADVYIRQIYLPSAALKATFGASNSMMTDVKFTDAATNETITSAKSVLATGGYQPGLLTGGVDILIAAAVNKSRKKEPYEVVAHHSARAVRSAITEQELNNPGALQ